MRIYDCDSPARFGLDEDIGALIFGDYRRLDTNLVESTGVILPRSPQKREEFLIMHEHLKTAAAQEIAARVLQEKLRDTFDKVLSGKLSYDDLMRDHSKEIAKGLTELYNKSPEFQAILNEARILSEMDAVIAQTRHTRLMLLAKGVRIGIIRSKEEKFTAKRYGYRKNKSTKRNRLTFGRGAK
jgi:hypothetical protein